MLGAARIGIAYASNAKPVEKEEAKAKMVIPGTYADLPENVTEVATGTFNNGTGDYRIAIFTFGDQMPGFVANVLDLVNNPKRDIDKLIADIHERYPNLGGVTRVVHVPPNGMYTFRMDWRSFAPLSGKPEISAMQFFLERSAWDKAPSISQQSALYAGGQTRLGGFSPGIIAANHRYFVCPSSFFGGSMLVAVGSVTSAPPLRQVSDWKAAQLTLSPGRMTNSPEKYAKNYHASGEQSALLLDGMFGAMGPNVYFGGMWPPKATMIRIQPTITPNGGILTFGKETVNISSDQVQKYFAEGDNAPIHLGTAEVNGKLVIRTLQPPVFASDEVRFEPKKVVRPRRGFMEPMTPPRATVTARPPRGPVEP